MVFEAGQKSQQLQFTVQDDEIPELNETFLLILMDSDCCVQVENNLTAIVHIVDNDRGSYIPIHVATCICVLKILCQYLVHTLFIATVPTSCRYI